MCFVAGFTLMGVFARELCVVFWVLILLCCVLLWYIGLFVFVLYFLCVADFGLFVLWTSLDASWLALKGLWHFFALWFNLRLFAFVLIVWLIADTTDLLVGYFVVAFVGLMTCIRVLFLFVYVAVVLHLLLCVLVILFNLRVFVALIWVWTVSFVCYALWLFNVG